MTAGRPDRHLLDEQKIKLSTELKAIAASLPQINMASPIEPEIRQYAKEFRDFFIYDVGLKVSEVEWVLFETTNKEEMHGIFIGVMHPDNTPESAKLFREALEKSGLKSKFTVRSLLYIRQRFSIYHRLQPIVRFAISLCHKS